MNDKIENHLNDYILIYSDCHFVRGSKNAVLYDLTKLEVYRIPAGYVSLASLFYAKKIGEIRKESSSEEWENINAFAEFLLDKKLATFVSDISVFPKMKLEWDEPNLIKSAIIDYNERYSNYDLQSVLEQLAALECVHLEIRTYSPFSFQFLDLLLKWLDPLFFKSVELIASDIKGLDLDKLEKKMRKWHVLNKITLTSAEKNHITSIKRTHNSIVHIVQTEQCVENNSHCGIINQHSLFSPDIKQFSEHHNFNSCLNRKISIDADGNIKNCPSMSKSYGNIANTSFKKVLQDPDFKKKWSITKNEIDVCKTCEFRYMCTDCRAYVQNPEDAYSKPLKCGYNPETGQWTDWMKNELSQKGISHYGFENQDTSTAVNK